MKVKFYPGHTFSGSLMTYLIHESFMLHGALLASGDRLTKDIGLSSARWQVISSLARADRPEPVANISRNIGRARQSVQRVADELEAEGFVKYEQNPHHRRAPVLVLTEKGLKASQKATSLQIPWVNALAKGIPPERLQEALDVLHTLRERLESYQSIRPRN